MRALTVTLGADISVLKRGIEAASQLVAASDFHRAVDQLMYSLNWIPISLKS